MKDSVSSSAGRASRRPRRWLIRLFHLWFLLRRPMTLGARAIVFDEEKNAVLLVRHTYVPGWQLPGGGVEVGETFEDALRREVLEEGNIELIGRPELRSVHFNKAATSRDHVALYLVRHFRQVGAHVPDREIAEAKFFPLDALPPELTAATRRRLAETFDGAEVAAEW